jgi:hypothetical protein
MSTPTPTPVATGPMRGPTRLRRVISDYLSATVPDLVDIARSQWDLAPWQLPAPRAYNAYDPYTLNVYPVVGVYIDPSEGQGRRGINDRHEEVYEFQHNTTVFCYARTAAVPGANWEQPTKDSAIRICNDLTYVVLNALLLDRTFGDPSVAARVKSSINWFEAERDNDASPVWICGATIRTQVGMVEALYRQPVGTADSIITDVEPVGLLEDLP